MYIRISFVKDIKTNHHRSKIGRLSDAVKKLKNGIATSEYGLNAYDNDMNSREIKPKP
jgi:hypothetical protein